MVIETRVYQVNGSLAIITLLFNVKPVLGIIDNLALCIYVSIKLKVLFSVKHSVCLKTPRVIFI